MNKSQVVYHIEGVFSLSVEPASSEKTGIQLLEETMESLGEFIQEYNSLINVTLDEFQEIVTLKPTQPCRLRQ